MGGHHTAKWHPYLIEWNRFTLDHMPLADLELTRKDAHRQLLGDFDYGRWNF